MMRTPRDEDVLHLIHSSPVAMVLCDATTIHYANGAAAALFGYPSPEPLEELNFIEDLTAPGSREECSEALAPLVAGTVVWCQLWYRALRADGSEFPAHARGHAYDGGEGLRALVTIVDCTAQVQERHHLDVLQKAVDAISEAIVVVRADGVVAYANSAASKLFGAPEKGLVGLDALALSTDEPETRRERYRVALAERGHAPLEVDLQTVDGRRFPAQVTVSLIDDPLTGEPVAMAVVRDLTEQRQLALERELREKQLAEMLREAHHRIRNTLQIACDVLTLQAVSAGSEEIDHALNRAATRIRALGAVHEQLTADQDVGRVLIRPIIESVVGNLRDMEGLRSPEHWGVEPADMAVTSREASGLALIVNELVSNVLRHTDARNVTVTLDVEGPDAHLEVTDDGTAEFAPGEATRAKGLGLDLVRLLAEEQLRGQFSLERHEGRTAARVTFPLQA